MTAEPDIAGLLSGAKSPDQLRDAVRGLLLQRLSSDPSLAPLLPLFDQGNTPMEPPQDRPSTEPPASAPVTDLPIERCAS
ncbi:hypothetical protein AB0B50_43340 [Streptomyces sp. NPDC041068]|uniref:hypothetical protein n=1 Tax=Streptomyces sp. NPDC041068 TaxID=3155130 RepID=UPI00340958FD